ncbi:DUF2804 domain-containing protein [Ureibacillus chungkukjangi]|uniref:Uncharacterized protein DUF2804 n=1 Tax=Ureibacillus chungkukjangi TaxID=1202712 RepID=A0A318TVR9_9BACL|nr:DUF2804 domain-containing protein [Ureibacillus chungkukjangi]MCM3387619.1 DUF2804 domain-containing protein [Ureibacillus chungkukjangi]PYF07937.1 uncharacterized protein DUF2804 [Ureibacillus chungkukjangi]HCG4535981.1 DUF2804 domain-containing protein [Salmonella enterica subsp. enterica serovar Typhi str. AG3]
MKQQDLNAHNDLQIQSNHQENVLLVIDGVRQYGRFKVRPHDADPLDESSKIPRALRRFRLKEWVGFTLFHPEISSSMILQEAHYLASSEIYVRDKQGMVEHSRNVRGGSLNLPHVLFPSKPFIDAKGYRIAYDWAEKPEGIHRIRVSVDASPNQEAIKMDLELDGSTASGPLSVSSPLPGGSMYTHKVAYPASGTVTVGDRTYIFDPTRDLAVLDEHRTALPYRTTWLWGTFAGITPDGIAGANFAQRPIVPGTDEESCLWTPGECEALSDITFVQESSDPLAKWRMTSADGRLDVTFTPEDRKDVKHQLVLASIDYWQMVGTYSGTVAGIEVNNMRGVCESMKARL